MRTQGRLPGLLAWGVAACLFASPIGAFANSGDESTTDADAPTSAAVTAAPPRGEHAEGTREQARRHAWEHAIASKPLDVAVEEGIAYTDLHVGKGAAVEKGGFFIFRLAFYDGEGTPIADLGDLTPYGSLYEIYGHSFWHAISSEQLVGSLEKGMAGMRANGKRLIRVSAEKALDEKGLTLGDAEVAPGTDLLAEISLISVRKVNADRLTRKTVPVVRNDSPKP